MKISKTIFALLALIFVTAIAAVDFVTHYETAVSILYLAPIILTAWSSWRFTVILIAVLSGISDVAANYIVSRSYAPINILNAGMQSVFFVVIAFFLLALKESRSNLKKLSRTDPLTGLANSRCFLELGNVEIQRALRYKHPFSVIYIDIDDFKNINDQSGHSAGDAFLRKIAKGMKDMLRITDTIARLGGDEFAMLLPETPAEAARVTVTRLRDAFMKMDMPDGRQVTFSAGIVTIAGYACSFDEVLKAADALMYEVKHAGKNATRQSTLDASLNKKG